MEDWFSEDLPMVARKSRPVRLLRNLEQKLLTGAVHATCPSHSMSEALANEFGCRPPEVIYNAFPWADRELLDGVIKDRKEPNVPSIHWFSQTLGLDRGLQDLIDALPFLNRRAEIHLRGTSSSEFEKWLRERVPKAWREQVIVHPLVSGAELLSRIAEHNIGFAGEMKFCRNKDLTISNKILQYLLGGLAVVASDTKGHREVAAQAPGAVFIYPSGDATALAAQINALLESADTLTRAKEAALQAAQRTFCWERQERALLSSVTRALSTTKTGVADTLRVPAQL
jgi:glycosyltransferase involved in cell wall biosynthesis